MFIWLWEYKQTTDINKPRSRIQSSKLKPPEMTIWSTKMADNQHFQYINKLPYCKEICGKSKHFTTPVKKLILTPAKDTGPEVPRWRR